MHPRRSARPAEAGSGIGGPAEVRLAQDPGDPAIGVDHDRALDAGPEHLLAHLAEAGGGPDDHGPLVHELGEVHPLASRPAPLCDDFTE